MLLKVVLTQPSQEKCLLVCKACGRTIHTADFFFFLQAHYRITRKHKTKGRTWMLNCFHYLPFNF